MSTFGRPLTDDGLIRVLDHWLDDGPVVAPHFMVESALRTAARTPQRQWRGRVLRFTGASPLVPVGLTLAAVAAVMALGAGLGQVLPLPGTEATPTPGLTDTPTPDASSPPSGWVVYTNEEDGYELTLPAALAATAQQPQDSGNPAPGVRGFGVGERSVYAVAISVGQPDGSITLCGVTGSTGYSGTNCDSVTVTSLDELEELLISTTDASLGDSEYHADTSLGGLPARVEAIRPGGMLLGPLAFHHVYAIHDGRPIVVSFDQWTLRNHLDDSSRGGILASFRLLESDNPSSGWVTYTNEEDGYELTLPAGLAADARPVPGRGEPWPGVRGFGHGQRWLYAVAISIGQPDGSITLCGIIRESPITTACHSVTVTSLDDLEEALISTADASLRDREYRGDVSLGGLPARVEAIRLGGLVLGPTAFHHVYAIHDGRPIVLSFDAYTLKQMGDSTRDAILESFRLLESELDAKTSPAPTASDWREMTDVAHGYALEVPAGWEDRECCSPGGRTLYAGEATPVTIMVGDPNGAITICQRGDCAEVVVTQMSDLRHAVQAVAPIDAASWRHTLRHDALILGGEPAEREWPDSIFGTGPEPIYDWVYTIHDGRPIVLRFNHFRGTFNPSEQQRMIETFDFLD